MDKRVEDSIEFIEEQIAICKHSIEYYQTNNVFSEETRKNFVKSQVLALEHFKTIIDILKNGTCDRTELCEFFKSRYGEAIKRENRRARMSNQIKGKHEPYELKGDNFEEI